ncbi:MAG: ATP-binding protein [Candidatus Binatia bacterium]|nr:ATP-binding protein [Candidatus Binatia bacterium]
MIDVSEIIGSAFPFYLVVGQELEVVASGPRLAEVAPDLVLGRNFLDCLMIERPEGIACAADIFEREGDLFILSIPDSRLRLRGQFYPFATRGAGRRLLFLGHPWISELAQLAGLGLTLGDFPPHACIADMLVLLQTKNSMLEESRRLAASLKHASKELSERNSQLEDELARRARLEETVVQAQKMEAIGQLAGGVAHDFNNILLAINGHASLALRGAGGDSPLKRHLENVLEASNRAAELTSRLLAFGRRQVMDPIAVSVDEALEEAEHVLTPLLGERVKLEINLPGSLGTVLIDPTAFQQVLLNLAINARDAFGATGGVIRVVGSSLSIREAKPCRLGELTPGEWVMITIQDDGSGINPAILDRIFDPFFTTKQQGQGTGLGLSTVWWILERINGALDVSSEPGNTVFSVYMRMDDGLGEDGSDSQASMGEGQLRPGRILLVEDEEMVRRPVRDMLKLLGWEVTEACCAEEAISFADNAEVPFDLVLTDMVMPGLGGRELAILLRDRWPELDLIFMTGYDPKAAKSELQTSEVTLSKPFDIDELEVILKSFGKRQ